MKVKIIDPEYGKVGEEIELTNPFSLIEEGKVEPVKGSKKEDKADDDNEEDE